jgi:hypothetical protein
MARLIIETARRHRVLNEPPSIPAALRDGHRAESLIGGVAAMEQSATQLDAFVRKVLAATGASKVDLVGHSEGTVMPRYWMEFLGGASLVSRYVMFTPIWHGTNLAGIGTVETLADQLNPSLSPAFTSLFGTLTTCVSCAELISASSFIKNLNAHGFALPGVTYTNVMTKYDELVWPYTSGYLNAPNVTNIVLQDQCPEDLGEHGTVAYDPTAAQDMLNALDPAHASAVPCVPVLPWWGRPPHRPGSGRLVFAITANHHYKLGRIRIGQRWSKRTGGFRIGTTACYLLQGVASNGVVRVGSGRVREIGIVDKRLTATRRATRQLLTSVS